MTTDHICENGVCHFIKKDDDKKTPAPAAENKQDKTKTQDKNESEVKSLLCDDERTRCEVWTRTCNGIP